MRHDQPVVEYIFHISYIYLFYISIYSFFCCDYSMTGWRNDPLIFHISTAADSSSADKLNKKIQLVMFAEDETINNGEWLEHREDMSADWFVTEVWPSKLECNEFLHHNWFTHHTLIYTCNYHEKRIERVEKSIRSVTVLFKLYINGRSGAFQRVRWVFKTNTGIRARLTTLLKQRRIGNFAILSI